MLQNAKGLAEALNKNLDDLGIPINIRERSIVLSKMLNIPKHQAWGLLEGQVFPDTDLLQRIGTELEIDVEVFSK